VNFINSDIFYDKISGIPQCDYNINEFSYYIIHRSCRSKRKLNFFRANTIMSKLESRSTTTTTIIIIIVQYQHRCARASQYILLWFGFYDSDIIMLMVFPFINIILQSHWPGKTRRVYKIFQYHIIIIFYLERWQIRSEKWLYNTDERLVIWYSKCYYTSKSIERNYKTLVNVCLFGLIHANNISLC